MVRRFTTVALFVLVAVATATGQAPAPPAVGTAAAVPATPALTDAQKKDIQIAALQVQNWELRAQQAASEFEKARAVLQQIIAASTPAGYQINERLELVKLPEAKKDK